MLQTLQYVNVALLLLGVEQVSIYQDTNETMPHYHVEYNTPMLYKVFRLSRWKII